MRKMLSLLIIGIQLTACLPGDSILNGNTITPDPSRASSSTPVSVPTKPPSHTATVKAIPSITVEPVFSPDAMSIDDLQSRVDAWVNGEIQFGENERLLDEITREPIRLAFLGQYDDPFTFHFYNIGFALVENTNGDMYIINMAGFEDGQGQRFSFPFHNGTFSETCNFIWLEKLKGQWINHGEIVSFDELTPEQLLKHSNEMIGTATLVFSWPGARGSAQNGCDRMEDRYYDQAGGLFVYLTRFLRCTDCSFNEAPTEIQGYINIVPAEFSSEIPFARDYKVRVE